MPAVQVVPAGRVPTGRARAWAGVGIGVLAVSVSAPVTSATAAAPLAVAFWRAAIGAAATGAYLGARRPGELRAAPAAVRRDAATAGLLLALHFGLWLPSLRLTSVTASTALVSTTPVWTVVLDRLRGAKVPRPVLAGVAVALAGMLAITGVDAGRSAGAALGDLLALLGGMAGAGYVVAGERARRWLSPAAYTTAACAVCTLLLLPVCLLGGVAVVGFTPRTWAEIAVVAVGAQLIGHGSLNAALPVVGATPLALALLFEVPGAAMVAWAWLGVPPPAAVLPGTLLVLAGLVVVVRAGRRPGDTAVVDVT
jgi:drug/metabolite transporter (DMT)-like permease